MSEFEHISEGLDRILEQVRQRMTAQSRADDDRERVCVCSLPEPSRREGAKR